jgi:hypothetical protein
VTEVYVGLGLVAASALMAWFKAFWIYDGGLFLIGCLLIVANL